MERYYLHVGRPQRLKIGFLRISWSSRSGNSTIAQNIRWHDTEPNQTLTRGIR